MTDEEVTSRDPGLGRHESYTFRSLNLTATELSDAYDTVGQTGPKWELHDVRCIPMVYMDGFAMMERVEDITTLRRGDHLMVGLNPVRTVSSTLDRVFQLLAHAEVIVYYHHFTMYDNVDAVRNGIPLTLSSEGLKPSMICEYGATPGGALGRVRNHPRGILGGLKALWDSPCPFQKIDLGSYIEGRSEQGAPPLGLFRIKDELTDTEREEIRANCDRLTRSFETYSVIFRNCEHSAFALSPKHNNTWVSPQVPALLWNMMRTTMTLLSMVFLVINDKPIESTRHSAGVFHALSAAYHIFSTVPVILQTIIILCRIIINITRLKERGLISKGAFNHLLYKNFFRAIFGGGLAASCLGLIPQLVWDTGMWSVACVLVLLAWPLGNMVFSIACFAAMKVIIHYHGSLTVPVRVSSHKACGATGKGVVRKAQSRDRLACSPSRLSRRKSCL